MGDRHWSTKASTDGVTGRRSCSRARSARVAENEPGITELVGEISPLLGMRARTRQDVLRRERAQQRVVAGALLVNACEQPIDDARLITRSEEKIRLSGAGPKHAAVHRGGSLQCPDDAGAYGHHAAAVLPGLGDRAGRRLGDLEALRHR